MCENAIWKKDGGRSESGGGEVQAEEMPLWSLAWGAGAHSERAIREHGLVLYQQHPAFT